VIATSVGFDLVFLVHVVAAVDVVIVFVAMRFAGQAVARGADESVQLTRFPRRQNWAARVLHLLPVSGVIMSLAGNSSLSLTKPWIGAGILCYHDGVASPEQGRSFVQSVDVLLALMGVALIAMLVQF